MADYIVYNSNGKIIRKGCCPDGFEFRQADERGEFVLIEAFRENTYVNASIVVDKSIMPSIINKETVVADEEDEIIISNLENPTDIMVERRINATQFSPVDFYSNIDGSFEISFDEADDYKITLSSLHFLDKEYIITATEA